jgi:hypothetical protein
VARWISACLEALADGTVASLAVAARQADSRCGRQDAACRPVEAVVHSIGLQQFPQVTAGLPQKR